eukprot:TRINITY_DN289_c0_g1_i20.p1 TRINITY_DN289_c0_g1~~TRINITY_DN289_c0_g1_i20.p1  ORF type:complete len:222 (+),score=78.91 TRINITY_DN289_c0_g1_i20:118-783(+)
MNSQNKVTDDMTDLYSVSHPQPTQYSIPEIKKDSDQIPIYPSLIKKESDQQTDPSPSSSSSSTSGLPIYPSQQSSAMDNIYGSAFIPSKSSESSESTDSIVQNHEGDWNGQFQTLMETLHTLKKGEQTSMSQMQVYESMKVLGNDFVSTAEMLGKIIISEVNVPADKKTIRPIKTTGHAGGEKYLVHNILFKFAIDEHGMYDGDENAMKAAGHELKSLMSV